MTQDKSGKSTIEEILDPQDLKLPKLPGSRGNPVLGETVPFLSSRDKLWRKNVKKYGKIFAVKALGLDIAYVGDIDVIKQLLLKDGGLWLQQGYPKSAKDIFGKHSLLMEDGELHKMHRKMILDNVLGHGKTPAYIGVVTDYAFEKVQALMSVKPGQAVPASVGLKEFTLRTTLRVVVGFEASDAEVSRMVKLLTDINDGLVSLPNPFGLGSYGRAMKARSELLKIVDGHIEKLQEKLDRGEDIALEHKHNGTSFTPVIGEMLKSKDETTGKPAFTREILCDQASFLMFAGLDTTSTTMTSFLLLTGYTKACGKDLMERLREEQRQVIAKHGNEITDEAIKDMKLLDACIQETHRVLPTVGGGMRIVKKNLKLTTASGEKYILPKSSRIIFSLLAVASYDENMELGLLATRQDWKKDVLDGFNPDIWLDDSIKKPVLMPFSYGVRKCVGYRLANLELSVFLSTLIRAGTWALQDGVNVPKSKRLPMPVAPRGLPIFYKKEAL